VRRFVLLTVGLILVLLFAEQKYKINQIKAQKTTRFLPYFQRWGFM